MDFQYCDDLYKYSRFKTQEVKIGNLFIGANHPICVQSMTNTDTLNTEASVEQCMRIFDAGADFVRLTVQTPKHAENLREIKNLLIQKSYNQPLIADVHFNPKVAEIAAQIVAKVRINPGNYIDKKTEKSYTDEEFKIEQLKIEKRFSKLIRICKENNTAVRIGVNHGSLSGRMLERYGDTSEGMVASVMEFLDIARKLNFKDIVISLKASNTRVMVFACRFLMHQMIQKGMNYPLHVGVTEAGGGEDGRIKSAVGIGTLLMDGIGDTIRISLTEDPEFEIPVAQKLLNILEENVSKNSEIIYSDYVKNPFEYKKRETNSEFDIGSAFVPVVIVNCASENIREDILKELKFKQKEAGQEWERTDLAPDYIYLGKNNAKKNDLSGPKYLVDSLVFNGYQNTFPVYQNIDTYNNSNKKSSLLNFILAKNEEDIFSKLDKIKNDKNIVLIVESEKNDCLHDNRAFIYLLIKKNILFPVIIMQKYDQKNIEDIQLKSSMEMGPLLIDGLIDGIILDVTEKKFKKNAVDISFGILQASRSRMSKTEYISCPSCGRTLFDIQKVTEEIKKKTQHLKKLKIGVMGCIVNGPGEMADADYGYVGTGIEKISLYKGHKIVKKNIPSKNAVDELIKLIKENGDWQELMMKTDIIF